MRGRTSDARGQALPLVALQLWLIAAVVVALALLGQRSLTRARAQVVADAVALAAANGGDAAALVPPGASVARADRDGAVDVVVSVNDVAAAGRAQRPARGATAGLDPRLVAAIGLAEGLLGEPVPIVSGLRTRAEQERLWANRHTNPYPVAEPGTSLHERGLAIDVPLTFAPRLAAVGPTIGLCQPLPASDPVHFVLCAA